MSTETGTDNSPLVDCFESTYRRSRERLLASMHRLSKTHSILIDSRSVPGRGPNGESLAQDFIIVGARRPRRALVISSGTHGVEGFAGSAIQHDFVENLLPHISIPGDTAIIIVHAHNPYGFAWLRRVTGNNVDLNRNFVQAFDPSIVSPDYETLYQALNPSDLSPENEALRWSELETFEQRNGRARTQQAAIEGQYKYPAGMQFGGHSTEPGVQNLLDLVAEHLTASTQVAWIDIHTGLGESGDCELISSMAPDTECFKAAKQIWPDIVSASAGDSISTPLNGVMDAGLSRAMPRECQFAMVFPEFGTHPVDRIIKAIRADNWLHQHGPEDVLLDSAASAIKAELLEAFRPDNAQWRMRIQETGRAFIKQGMSAISGLG